jgi:hypothetical protein
MRLGFAERPPLARNRSERVTAGYSGTLPRRRDEWRARGFLVTNSWRQVAFGEASQIDGALAEAVIPKWLRRPCP